jgi:hypothetical protein
MNFIKNIIFFKEGKLTRTNRLRFDRRLGNNFPTIVDITGINRPKMIIKTNLSVSFQKKNY